MNTTLETNAILLQRRDASSVEREGKGWNRSVGAGGQVVEPCYIEDGVTIEHSTVGPNVSVEAGTVIRGSSLRDAIVGAKCVIEDSRLSEAMLGDDVVVRGVTGSLSVGSHSEVRGG